MKSFKFLGLLGLVYASSTFVHAQSVWTGGGANWSSNANPGWNGTGVPDAVGATANATAAGGTITVNGNYTLGTLTQCGTTARSLNTSTGGTLIFDVSSGTALWDMSTGLSGAGTSASTSHSTNLQLNDNLEIRTLVSTGSTTPVLSGNISGSGELQLRNAATTPISGGARFDLRGNNTFSGGINVGNGTALRLNASNAAGNGTITLADTGSGGNSLDFRVDVNTTQKTYNNNINFGTRSSGSSVIMTLQGNTTNVIINGTLSGAMGNTGRINLNGGTLTLGGSSNNTWTGQLRSDSHGTLIANKVGAINNGFSMRSGSANQTTSLLFGVSDTISGLISTDGSNAGAGIAYTARIGLADGNNGAVTVSNASKINLVNTWGNGASSNTTTTTSLQLHSGNGNGTLNVTTEIGTNPGNARNIEITGTGTVNLNRAAGNTYEGNTLVSAGTLLVNNTTGSATSTGTVTVASGAILGGNGTISGPASITGSLRPGNSIGTLNIGNNVTWNSGDNWVFELGAGNTADLLNITGDFLRGTGSAFTFDFAGSTDLGTFELVDWTGTTNFVLGNFSYTNLGGGNTGSFAFNGTQLEFTVIPEPSTWALLAGGLTALAAVRRRRQG